MKFDWKEAVIFIGFIALATMLWYGHAMTSTRTENIEVQVRYTGISSTIAFKDSLPAFITVEVRDAGQRLKTYFKDQPTISINLAPQLENEVGEVVVSEEKLRSSVTSILQGTSKLLTIAPATIRTPYYTLSQKMVPIRLMANIQPASEYQLVGEPTLSLPEVGVVGLKDSLNTITEVKTRQLTLTNVKDTTTVFVPLETPTGMRLTRDSIQVSIVAERFTEKVFHLPIEPKQVPSGMKVRFFPSEVTVTVTCPVRQFHQVTAEDVDVYCVIPHQTQNHLPVYVQKKDSAIHSLRVKPSHVEYILEQQ